MNEGGSPENGRLILGTRGSDLARAQTAMAMSGLRERWPQLEIEVRIIKTTGDIRSVEPTEARAGRKGLFTAEIERALLDGEIDVAVHSAKDLPSQATTELRLGAVLPRAGVEDVIVSKNAGGLAGLPRGSVVATGSVRRQHQLRWQRPDLRFFPLRGNVPTRLRQLEENSWGAIVLARAGLERLGYFAGGSELRFGGRSYGIEVLSGEVFLPAGGQGVIGLQIRGGDSKMLALSGSLNDPGTFQCLRAEREFLRLLEADCGTPVGVLATLEGTAMKIRGQIFEPEQATPRMAGVEGRADDPEHLAQQLLETINGN